jgi:hypothetical protein
MLSLFSFYFCNICFITLQTASSTAAVTRKMEHAAPVTPEPAQQRAACLDDCLRVI